MIPFDYWRGPKRCGHYQMESQAIIDLLLETSRRSVDWAVHPVICDPFVPLRRLQLLSSSGPLLPSAARSASHSWRTGCLKHRLFQEKGLLRSRTSSLFLIGRGIYNMSHGIGKKE
ncbi:hypothetical protein Nepgr_033270 [Nepenthes gracilis]|uniref:Uncharacterized protein n=1 Tax=Nepenthes gracilis TaxID=150966 RepID=A0AAD3TMC8_NEPGR|nr:hypothetical protein Nepgr_033270 [Nepenthes gracilis]